MQKYKAWSGPCACNPHRLLVFVFSYLVYPVGMGSLEVTKRMSVMLFCWFIAWLNWLMWKGNLSRRPGTVVAMRAVRRWGGGLGQRERGAWGTATRIEIFKHRSKHNLDRGLFCTSCPLALIYTTSSFQGYTGYTGQVKAQP